MRLATTLGAAALAFFLPAAAAQDGDELDWKAHDFTLTDAAGKTFELSACGDDVVVLEWTNHQCPFVKRVYARDEDEPGLVQSLSAKYRKKGVVWVAIDSTAGHTAKEVKKVAAERGIAHPILLDSDGKVGRLYGAKTTPHVFVIKKNKILYQGALDDGPRGRAKKHYLARALDEILAGKPVTTKSTKPYGCRIEYPEE